VLTLRRPRTTRPEGSVAVPSGASPVMLATLDVPFAEEAAAFAVDSAVEAGQPLVVVNVAEVPPTPSTFAGWGYIEHEGLQNELRKPAELARSLAVEVERLRVCSPHPVDALLELVRERRPGLLVFGPDRSRLRPRRYRKAEKKLRERAPCLLWLPD